MFEPWRLGLLRSMPEPNDAIGSNSGSGDDDTRRAGAEVSLAATGNTGSASCSPVVLACSPVERSAGAFCDPVAIAAMPFVPFVGGVGRGAPSQPFAVETSDDRSGPGDGGGGGAGCAAGAGAAMTGDAPDFFFDFGASS